MVSLDVWSFIPGPTTNPPQSSVVLSDFVEYPPQEIARAIMAFPGMRLRHADDQDWWQWSAEWRQGRRHIGIGMTLMQTEPESWGGSQLNGACDLTDILGLWGTIRSRCPGVWMHNIDCDIHTPESFTQLFPA